LLLLAFNAAARTIAQSLHAAWGGLEILGRGVEDDDGEIDALPR
jgi:hypothetical protein